MIPLTAFTFVLVAYLCGCLNGAYYIGKITSKQDIRNLGSSNAGARNAGRVFGRSAFIYTVVIDALKTIIPLLLVSYLFEASGIVLGWMALASLIGHIWPIQLQFRGGKGVVVYLAAALSLAPLTLVVVGLTLLVGLQIKRNFSLIGLVAISTIPVTLLIVSKYMLAGVFLIMLLIVIYAHGKED